VPIVLKSGSINLLEPSGTVQACNGIAFRLPITRKHSIKAGPFSAGVGALYGPLIRVLYLLPASVIRTEMTVFKTNVILNFFFPEQELEFNIYILVHLFTQRHTLI
jgi:hypothetical protein